MDRANHHLFQPLLYQVATASLAAPDIARSLRQILADASNVTVLMDEISKLSLGEREAVGESGQRYRYDYLVLATGVRTSFFGRPEWEPHTLGLKSLSEAQDIRRRVLSNLERAELVQGEARQRLEELIPSYGRSLDDDLDLVHEIRQYTLSTLALDRS